jgi:hypothetical protein
MIVAHSLIAHSAPSLRDNVAQRMSQRPLAPPAAPSVNGEGDVVAPEVFVPTDVIAPPDTGETAASKGSHDGQAAPPALAPDSAPVPDLFPAPDPLPEPNRLTDADAVEDHGHSLPQTSGDEALTLPLPAVIDAGGGDLPVQPTLAVGTPPLTQHPDQARSGPHVWIGLWALSLAIAGGIGAGIGMGLRVTTQFPPAHSKASHAESALVWSDLFSPGAASPRGQQAANVAADEALTIADMKLHGVDGAPDPDEARYWLRVGLDKIMDDKRLSWALTQLGTLYARPGAPAEAFSTARTLWDLAAAKGDPIALCFLAALEEGGLAARANTARALSLYRKAKEAGGCDAADEAIQRLSGNPR